MLTVCRSLYYIHVITINSPVFWVITTYRLVHRNLCFGAACSLQFHPSPTIVAYREEEGSADALVHLYLTTRSHMPETDIIIIITYRNT